MRKILTICGLVLLSSSMLATTKGKSLKENFKLGSPEIQSMNALAFGPEGILFVGDSKSATVYAIDTQDEAAQSAQAVRMQDIDKGIAELFGTTTDQINISDMAVNPTSKNIYFSVHNSDGTPALVRLSGEAFEVVKLDNIKFSEVSISNPVGVDAKDRRGRSQRVWAISDLNYFDGKVMVTGLSNQEFGSTFRSINFPFSGDQLQSSLEIYHAAHGQYETFAPVKTFTAATLNGQPHVIAGYTCTPLVVFPMDDLKGGEHVKGRTVAELGNWNTPLDMITMEKNGNSYLLMANSSRAVMKIKFEDLENFSSSLTTRVEERSGTEGVDFIALPFVNVLQLDKLDESQFVMLQRTSNGNLILQTQPNRWL